MCINPQNHTIPRALQLTVVERPVTYTFEDEEWKHLDGEEDSFHELSHEDIFPYENVVTTISDEGLINPYEKSYITSNKKGLKNQNKKTKFKEKEDSKINSFEVGWKYPDDDVLGNPDEEAWMKTHGEDWRESHEDEFNLVEDWLSQDNSWHQKQSQRLTKQEKQCLEGNIFTCLFLSKRKRRQSSKLTKPVQEKKGVRGVYNWWDQHKRCKFSKSMGNSLLDARDLISYNQKMKKLKLHMRDRLDIKKNSKDKSSTLPAVGKRSFWRGNVQENFRNLSPNAPKQRWGREALLEKKINWQNRWLESHTPSDNDISDFERESWNLKKHWSSVPTDEISLIAKTIVAELKADKQYE